jgi:hypothetical protein
MSRVAGVGWSQVRSMSARVNVKALSTFMGHSSITITLRGYFFLGRDLCVWPPR